MIDSNKKRRNGGENTSLSPMPSTDPDRLESPRLRPGRTRKPISRVIVKGIIYHNANCSYRQRTTGTPQKADPKNTLYL